MNKVLIGLGFLLLLLSGCSSGKDVVLTDEEILEATPTPPSEFRAAWVATVDNIDWPSQKGLPVATQKAEMIAILDRARELNLNAIIFQVRPTTDALYYSTLEPWSEYLTGQQGIPPVPFYDPLSFTIEEGHKRGLEVHAWFNPFRAFHPSATGPLAQNHVSKKNPQIVKQYGDLMWLDPSDTQSQYHSLQVILDVVNRYDLDGVHIDDYFYPYAIKDQSGNTIDFPDSPNWQRAQQSGNTLSKSDWRRSHINRFVERLYQDIKQTKPWVKVGISPFGIWKPGFPPQVTGFDAHEGLYADARKWLNEGWIDYYSPQLYWEISSRGQSYPILLNWWISENNHNRHMWPGNFTSRVIDEGNRRWNTKEIIDQVKLTQQTVGASGNVHFSMKAIMPRLEQMGERLLEQVYTSPSMVPVSPWLGSGKPSKPVTSYHLENERAVIQLDALDNVPIRWWLVRARYGDKWRTFRIPYQQKRIVLDAFNQEQIPRFVVVSAISKTGVEGAVSIARKPSKNK